MRSMLKQNVRTDRVVEAEPETDAAAALLQEITEDARKIESRYAKDSRVPEGGE